ncbi:MAG TPA: hypothetical protein VFY93_19610 [Planctomycetota bacterium]|nr:hypothetical protein [Planctomycetota bacterium]
MPRLRKKIEETKALAAEKGIDLATAPLLVTFEMPPWGPLAVTAEIGELVRKPGTAIAVISVDPLPEVRAAMEAAPYVHIIAERGLVCGLSGGAVLHAYPQSTTEMQAFACALFAGAAPDMLRVSLAGFVSSGRQEVTFEGMASTPVPSVRELLQAIRNHGGTPVEAAEEAAIVLGDPSELEAVRAALAGDLAGCAVRVTRLPSGRFRFLPDPQPRPEASQKVQILAQEIAVSCDRFTEMRGVTTFGFVTESVARWQHGPEQGARRLASELFPGPDTAITHIGLHPFGGEGTVFFAYEGSETVWEAANKGVTCVTVRDIHEYGRVLHEIRKGA